MSKDFAPKFGDDGTDCCITTHCLTFPCFAREFLTKNNMTVVPHPHYFSRFPRLKIKLKNRHFDATDVLEAEPQAGLNTLTENDFQEAFKWQKRWERCIHAERNYFEGDGAQ
jgi:hypothetical protein